MIILIGFIETIIIALLSILLGFFIASELFKEELAKQLLKYDHDRMLEELKEYSK